MCGISCSSWRRMVIARRISASCLLGCTSLRKLLLLWQDLLVHLLLIWWLGILHDCVSAFSMRGII